jgi:hypothetical protein
MAAAAVGLALTPETRTVAPADRPRYHRQRIKAPAGARAPFAAFIAFAALALFVSLAPTFLAGAYFRSSLRTVLAPSDPGNRAGLPTVFFLIGYIGLSIPAVGLGVLAQHVAAKTALLIFGAVLVAGVAASLGFLLRRPGIDRALVATSAADVFEG